MRLAVLYAVFLVAPAFAADPSTPLERVGAGVLMLAGSRQEKAGDLDGALKSYSDAIAAAPDVDLPYVSRASVWLRKNDPDRALADANRAIELNPRNAMAFTERGRARAAKNNHPQAVADFDEAIRLSPDDAFNYLYRGMSLGRTDRDRADADLTRYVTMRPTDPEGLCHRGYLRMMGGENHRSTLDFNEAVRIDPKNATAYRFRGVAYTRMKDYDRALADLDEAVRLSPKQAAAYLDRANLFLKRSDPARAIQDYTEAVTVDPNYAPAYNLRAWTRATSPDPSVRNGELAVADARRACELTRWENPDYLDTLAAAEAECGRFDEAVRAENRALENAEYAKSQFAVGARDRLKIYQEGKAYREGAAPEVPAAVRGHEPSPRQAMAGSIVKASVGVVVLLLIAWRLHRHGVFPFRRSSSPAPSFEEVESPPAADSQPDDPTAPAPPGPM